MAPRRDNGGCSVPPPDDVINKNSTHAVRVAANLGSTSWHRRKQVTKESPERPFSISLEIFRHAQKTAFAELCRCQCAGWRDSRTNDESSITGVVVYRTTTPAIGRVVIKSNALPGGRCSTIGKHVDLTYPCTAHPIFFTTNLQNITQGFPQLHDALLCSSTHSLFVGPSAFTTPAPPASCDALLSACGSLLSSPTRNLEPSWAVATPGPCGCTGRS